jgi:hypothetical protein
MPETSLVLLDRTTGTVPAPVVARFAYGARGTDARSGEEVGTLEVYAKRRHSTSSGGGGGSTSSSRSNSSSSDSHYDSDGDLDDSIDEFEESGAAGGAAWRAARGWQEWELEVLIGSCELVCQYWRNMGKRFRNGIGTSRYAAGRAARAAALRETGADALADMF